MEVTKLVVFQVGAWRARTADVPWSGRVENQRRDGRVVQQQLQQCPVQLPLFPVPLLAPDVTNIVTSHCDHPSDVTTGHVTHTRHNTMTICHV